MDAGERRLLFEQTAANMGVLPVVAEKDFWVCWMLKRVFDLPEEHPNLLFKGGTTLSKLYKLTKRFSEDIDLSIDRHTLGFEGERDPANIRGSKARNRLLDELTQECHRYIAAELLPALTEKIANELRTESGWSFDVDPRDRGVLSFKYPRSENQDWGSAEYLRPVVRLELGAKSDHWPASDQVLSSYSAEEFPSFFEEPSCVVRALDASRTFWEKTTILHKLYHGGVEQAEKGRKSRHYYDVVQIARSPLCASILSEIALLEDVAAHMSAFFHSAWARYDEARPGTLKLAPSKEIARVLERDYDEMQIMIFDDSPPTFEEIVEELEDLEDRINTQA